MTEIGTPERKLEIFWEFLKYGEITIVQFNAVRDFENACARHGVGIEPTVGGKDIKKYKEGKKTICTKMLGNIRNSSEEDRVTYASEILRDINYLEQFSGLSAEEIQTGLGLNKEELETLKRHLARQFPPENDPGIQPM